MVTPPPKMYFSFSNNIRKLKLNLKIISIGLQGEDGAIGLIGLPGQPGLSGEKGEAGADGFPVRTQKCLLLCP